MTLIPASDSPASWVRAAPESATCANHAASRATSPCLQEASAASMRCASGSSGPRRGTSSLWFEDLERDGGNQLPILDVHAIVERSHEALGRWRSSRDLRCLGDRARPWPRLDGFR